MVGAETRYLAPKTKGSRRRVPLTTETTELLREYLGAHPRADEPTAPLFPGMVLGPYRPTGLRAMSTNGRLDSRDPKVRARRQAEALAELAVDDAEKRLVLDWDSPLRHPTFYKAIYRPAVLRTNREAGATVLSPELKFHALRHTYTSLCVAAGIKPAKLSGRMGHANVRTTMDV
jgi:integrase